MEQTIETSSHVRLDRRSLEMHRLIVEKIRRDSGLFLKAIDNVERWKNASKTVPSYLANGKRYFEKVWTLPFLSYSRTASEQPRCGNPRPLQAS
jgi:hypothetical protein